MLCYVNAWIISNFIPYEGKGTEAEDQYRVLRYCFHNAATTSP
jgi:hypothetical protein